MNTTARHSSGHEHPSHPRRFSVRYPYTTGLLAVISFIVCLGWLLTHEACTHPLGNGLAAFWAFVGVPLLLGVIVEEAGE